MAKKRFNNANYNSIDNYNSNSDSDSFKRPFILLTSLLITLIFFIFTFSNFDKDIIKGPLKPEDFLPSRTRNLTLMSTLSSEIRLEKNLIFIGDVHGSLDELKSLIKELNYNSELDHLIFVGDLITKGPKSIELLRYLQSLGVSCVRGNHEDKVLKWRQFLDDLKIESGDGDEKQVEDEEVVDSRIKKYFQEKNLPIDEEAVFKSKHKLLAT